MQPTLAEQNTIAKHNFLIMLMEGAVFNLAMSFLEGNTVVSVFIQANTGQLRLAGLAQALRTNAPVIAQIIIGIFIHAIPSHTRFIRWIGFLTRPLLLLMVPVLLMGVWGPAAATIFIILYGLFFCLDGFIMMPWIETMTRTIPANRRGRLLGYQQFLGGAFSLVGGFIIKFVMDLQTLTDPVRYAIIFGSAGAILTCNAFLLAQIREIPREPEPKIDARAYFSNFIPLLRESRAYRTGVLCRVLYTASAMVYPLLALYGRLALGITPQQLSTLIYIQILGVLIGGFLWGQISGRWGSGHVILSGMVVSILSSSFALLAPHIGADPFPALVLAVLAAGINQGNFTGYTTYIAEISPERHRAQYLIMQGLILFPVGFTPVIAGNLADRIGFTPVFIAAIAFAAVGLVVAALLVRGRRKEARV